MDNSSHNISMTNIVDEKTLRVTTIDVRNSSPPCSNNNNYSSYETRINMPNGPLTSIYHELIPYPTSLISTIIENADEHAMNRSTLNKTRVERLKKRKQLINQTSQSSPDTESIASQQDNNNINDSQICFDKFDIGQIVKRLQEKIDSSTQTNLHEQMNQYTQVNLTNGLDETTVRAEQQRTNQSLRNQIQQLNYIIEEMSKERSNHNIYVHGLQKQLNDKEIKIKQYDDDNKRLLADKQQLMIAVNNSEIKLSSFQQEALSIRKENESLKLKLNQFSMTPEITNLMNQKDTTINELNNHILAYQQENIRLNSNIRFLNERLQTRETSDKNVVDAINTKAQEKQLLINNRLKMVQSECSKLKQQLSELKVHFKKTLGDIVRDNADNITEQIMPLISSLLAPPKNCRNCNELILEMNKLKQFNQQLLQENMQKTNDIFIMEQLRNENEKLKVHNVKLKDDVESMNETLNELQIEYEASQLRINQCNATIRQLQNESRNNSDNEVLRSENAELREQIASLERNNSVIKEKYEQICRELNINGTERVISSSQPQNDLSTESSTTDNSNQEGSQANLAEEMKQLIYQKNSQIQEQNSNIQDLKSQVEELRTMVSEYENGQNITSKIIEENELQIQQLNSVILNQTNQIDQRIMMLENELAQERNRSKSLSLSLANEKSANARLETEFFRLQEEYFKGPRANVIYEDSNHESEPATMENDVQTLKQELLSRIRQLKQLLNANNNNNNSNASIQAQSNDDNNSSSNNDNSTSPTDNVPTLSSNELLIQFLLDQTENLEQMNEQT